MGSLPVMAASRPPGASRPSSAGGTSATEPASRMASNGPPARQAAKSFAQASAWRTSTLVTPACIRRVRACEASAGSISSDSTRCARLAMRAAW
ncbi:hypothetical protein D9M68_924280 [compost metagenome]